MKKLLSKEIRLAASPLSWIFLAATLMTLLPGYPILMGAFFVCFGVFHSFQNAREANDTLYTVLLPVKKTDCVSAKYVFTCFIQLIGYGTGFLRAWWLRCICGRNEELQAFKDNFYK